MASALRFVPTCSNATKRPRRRTHLLRVRRQIISPSELDVESGVLAILARPCAAFYGSAFRTYDLLTSLPIHVECDKAGLNSSPKEGVDETISKATLPANESSTLQRACNSNCRRAAERTDQRSDGTTDQRSGSKKRAAWKRRRG